MLIDEKAIVRFMEYDIRPKGKLTIGFKELWEYRELFMFFTWRDIKVKYKQTSLGVLWVILQPLIMTLLFSVFFKSLNNKSSVIPYPIFVLSGLVIWTMFSSAIMNAGNSMVSNANIIKKIYFPRLIIPVSSILTSLFDMLFGVIILVAAIFYYHVSLNSSVIWLWPLAIIVSGISALGLGTFLSALNVKYRDFRYIIPFLIQAMLFLSPVIYSEQTNNSLLNFLLQLNPVTAGIELFRSAFLGYEPQWNAIKISLLSNFLLLIVGIFYFKKTESYFADIA
ncbi:MAG: ABC transporter permease [Bacteroidota bacterium]